LAGQAVDPDEAEDGADGDGDQADQDAGTAHALEEIERGEAPDYFAEFAIAQEAIFGEIDEARTKDRAKAA